MDELMARIKRIHEDCQGICIATLGKYLPVAGNVGVFCQNEDEYKLWSGLKEQITEKSGNRSQKYFRLKEKIIFRRTGSLPATAYDWLYIRQPDPTDYGKYLGDVDFVLDPHKYAELKKEVIQGNKVPGLTLYNRPGWDTIQLTDPAFGSVAYVSTGEFAEKVRVKFD